MIDDDPSDEKSKITYKLEKSEDNEMYGIQVIDDDQNLDAEQFLLELEYFIKHARETDFRVFEHLDEPQNELH